MITATTAMTHTARSPLKDREARDAPHEQQACQIWRISRVHDGTGPPVEGGRQERETGFVKQATEEVVPAAPAMV